MKANSNLAILDLFARLGSGFDIVSGGELFRVMKAGGDPRKVVFCGVGKRDDEIAFALEAGVRVLNVESGPELARVSIVARRMGLRAPIALRVNPDVDPKTHPYISTGLRDNKFGVSVDEARRLYALAAKDPALEVKGVACHIGSQITTLRPFLDAVARVLALAKDLGRQGHPARPPGRGRRARHHLLRRGPAAPGRLRRGRRQGARAVRRRGAARARPRARGERRRPR